MMEIGALCRSRFFLFLSFYACPPPPGVPSPFSETKRGSVQKKKGKISLCLFHLSLLCNLQSAKSCYSRNVLLYIDTRGGGSSESTKQAREDVRSFWEFPWVARALSFLRRVFLVSWLWRGFRSSGSDEEVQAILLTLLLLCLSHSARNKPTLVVLRCS